MMDSEILVVENLCKTYKTKKGVLSVLDNLNLKFGKGIIAILGANGAGKTTFIKSCTDLLTFDSGQISYMGHSLSSMTKKEKCQMYSLLSEGNRNIYWKLSPIENIKYFSALRGIEYKKIEGFCLDALNELNLYEKKDELVENLSRGMQQKVAVVCALSMNTNVIFLDEPTLGLDIESTIHLSKFLSNNESLKDKLICITSHDFSFIESTTKFVFKLQNGTLISKDSVYDIDSSYLIKVDVANLENLKMEGYEVVEETPQYCTIKVSVPYYKLGEAISDINLKGFNVFSVEAEKYDIANFYLNK